MRTFKVQSNILVISDPCYTLDTWCQGIVKDVKNGVWTANVEIDPSSKRVAAIYCYNNDAYIQNTSLVSNVFNAPKLPIVIGVDSGQAGFFDYDHYRKDESIGDATLATFIELNEPGSKFYSACCACTCDNKDQFGTIPFGAVSSSGWGDGSYDCHGLKDLNGNEYVAFVIKFIEQDDENDDEEGWDEEYNEDEQD